MSSEVKKVLFIVNKYSGGGYQPEVEGRIIDLCQENDIECTIEYTQARGHATELAQLAVAEKKYAQVVAVGGDGTVNEVARGLLSSEIPLGILPKGSGNGLARHLGIPMKIIPALKSFFTSQVVRMDTFRMNGKLSLNVSGIGFDGHIANLFSNDKKRGLQGYTKLALREFFQFKEFEAELKTENKTTHHKAFIIAIANSSQYGNNARIAPLASVCDELLHLSILKKVPPYRLDFLYDLFQGKIDRSPYCDVMEVKNIKISVNTPIAFHIDGEPSGHATTFDIEILPCSLHMMVPQKTLRP